MASRAVRMRLPAFFCIALLHHLNAHGAGGTLNHAHRGFDRVAVQVLHLLLRNLLDLRLRYGTDRLAARCFRSGRKLRRLLQKIGNRRRPEFEGEGFVLVYGDGDGNWHPLLHLLRLRVEILAELHDVEPALAQGRADRRGRIGRPRGHLQLQKTGNFLRHSSLPSGPEVSGPGFVVRSGRAAKRVLASHKDVQPFSTWLNSSSTGVARPKILTATLSRERSSSTSSTVPLNDANGPSETRTCSPTSKTIEGLVTTPRST